MEKEIREAIRKCNEHKASLLANKDSYAKEYFRFKLKEYEDFTKTKQDELRKHRANKALAKRSFAAIFILLFIGAGLFFTQPEFIGLVTYENAEDTNMTEANISLDNETILLNRTIVNITGLLNASNATNISNATIEIAEPIINTSLINASENITNATSAADKGGTVTVEQEITINASNVTIADVTLNARGYDY